MKVLVTGGAGFVGSHLVEMLVEAGHTVTVVDSLVTGSPENVNPSARLVVRDIRDALETPFAESRPEVVIHLAAQVSVPQSVADPAEDVAVNVTGSANVLQTAARFGVRKIIMISSAAVYGAPHSLPLREDAPLAPLTPYGLSKMVGEMYTRLLCAQYGMAYTVLRPANVYGPRQTAGGDGAVIPSFLERFAQGRDPIIHGDGLQTRDFIYVQDVARAVVAALAAGDNRTFNVSTGAPVSVLDAWRAIAQLLGWQGEPRFGPPRAGDIRHSVLSSSAAQETLAWRPSVTWTEGLARTVEWWTSRKSLSTPAQADAHKAAYRL